MEVRIACEVCVAILLIKSVMSRGSGQWMAVPWSFGLVSLVQIAGVSTYSSGYWERFPRSPCRQRSVQFEFQLESHVTRYKPYIFQGNIDGSHPEWLCGTDVKVECGSARIVSFMLLANEFRVRKVQRFTEAALSSCAFAYQYAFQISLKSFLGKKRNRGKQKYYILKRRSIRNTLFIFINLTEMWKRFLASVGIIRKRWIFITPHVTFNHTWDNGFYRFGDQLFIITGFHSLSKRSYELLIKVIFPIRL